MRTVKDVIRQSIENIIDDFEDSKLIEFHREYCDTHHYTDDYIYNNDELFYEENFSSAYELAKAIDSDYSLYRDYVMFDGNGNLKTFNNLRDEIDIPSLVTYFYDYELENLNTSDIKFDSLWENLTSALEESDNIYYIRRLISNETGEEDRWLNPGDKDLQDIAYHILTNYGEEYEDIEI